MILCPGSFPSFDGTMSDDMAVNKYYNKLGNVLCILFKNV